MEYLNSTYDSEAFAYIDLNGLSHVPSPDECSMTWPNNLSKSTISFSAFPAGDVSPSPAEGDLSHHEEQNWDDLGTPIRRSRSQEGKEQTASQRVLRRRIQNRTSQRTFRERREEERKTLEHKLEVVKDEYRLLVKTCTEFHGVVEMLCHQLGRLEAENDALRTKTNYKP